MHFAFTYHRKPLRSNFQGCTEKTTFWHELHTCRTHLTQDMRELVPSAPLHRLNLNSPKPNTTHVLSAPKHDTRAGAQFEWNMHAPNGSLSEINASIFFIIFNGVYRFSNLAKICALLNTKIFLRLLCWEWPIRGFLVVNPGSITTQEGWGPEDIRNTLQVPVNPQRLRKNLINWGV